MRYGRSSNDPSNLPQLLAHPAAPWIAFALLLALRCVWLGHAGLWNDELITLNSVRMGWGTLAIERMQQGHFPTYFWLLKAWTLLAGDREWALRFPSVVIATAALPFIFHAVRRTWGAEAAWWSLLFFALHGRLLWAAQEARPYALAYLAAAASLDAALRALQPAAGRRAGPWWAAYAAWSLLGLTSHGTYLFVFLAQTGVLAGWQTWRRRLNAGWLAAALATGIGAGAAFLALRHFQTNGQLLHDRELPAWNDLRRGFIELFWGEFSHWGGTGLKLVFGPLALAAVALAWRGARRLRPRPAEAPAFALVIGWTFSALAGLPVASLVSGSNLADTVRYFMIGTGGAAVLLGLAVAGLGRWPVRWRAGMAVALLLTPTLLGEYADRHEEIREAIQTAQAEAPAAVPIVLCKGNKAGLLGDYYGDGRAFFGIDRDLATAEQVAAALESAVGGSERYWLIDYKLEEDDKALLAGAKLYAQRHGLQRKSRRDFEEAKLILYAR